MKKKELYVRQINMENMDNILPTGLELVYKNGEDFTGEIGIIIKKSDAKKTKKEEKTINSFFGKKTITEYITLEGEKYSLVLNYNNKKYNLTLSKFPSGRDKYFDDIEKIWKNCFNFQMKKENLANSSLIELIENTISK